MTPQWRVYWRYTYIRDRYVVVNYAALVTRFASAQTRRRPGRAYEYAPALVTVIRRRWR